ncbi:DUF1572 family protein [Metasolibacillus meyeri]|uniref:DUF1572 family protein n=1 Tax=Metasolibacillus meyeri TaxID=1071052 RepID=A0AAW9NTQ2_9BACL|nr:DUF1572 family protein [Metasolibacillus meyeri]MEC1178158.1 DUF1572 family protein [Metasolibacillus meyeri]
MEFGKVYLTVIQERFKGLKDLGDKTIARLSEEELHWTIHESSNSISIIIRHMSGNMISRWTDFLTSDGEKSSRNREEEFMNTMTTKEELLAIWEKGWCTLFQALEKLSAEQLQSTVYIRGEAHMAVEAIERQVAHYAMHVGQILFIGKQIKKDEWESLSIPKGQSNEYNEMMFNKGGNHDK